MPLPTGRGHTKKSDTKAVFKAEAVVAISKLPESITYSANPNGSKFQFFFKTKWQRGHTKQDLLRKTQYRKIKETYSTSREQKLQTKQKTKT